MKLTLLWHNGFTFELYFYFDKNVDKKPMQEVKSNLIHNK